MIPHTLHHFCLTWDVLPYLFHGADFAFSADDFAWVNDDMAFDDAIFSHHGADGCLKFFEFVGFLAPTAHNQPWLDSALAVVGRLLAQLEAAGIPPERTFLLGFSQGACLALEYAARNAQRYAGLAGLSGALIGGDDEPPQARGHLAGTPVFLGCSDYDPHIPRYRFEQVVERYQGDRRVRSLNCWTQLVALIYAQLAQRLSLRDLEMAFNSHAACHYHLGASLVRGSTLADANASRNPSLFREVFFWLLSRLRGEMSEARELVRLIDSTRIDLNLNRAMCMCLCLMPSMQGPQIVTIKPCICKTTHSRGNENDFSLDNIDGASYHTWTLYLGVDTGRGVLPKAHYQIPDSIDGEV